MTHPSVTHLLADERDLGIRVPDLVALIQHDVAPPLWQQQCPVQPQLVICGEQQASRVGQRLPYERLPVRGTQSVWRSEIGEAFFLDEGPCACYG